MNEILFMGKEVRTGIWTESDSIEFGRPHAVIGGVFVYAETVGQFTGRYAGEDSERVFVGHIIHNVNGIFAVEWNDDTCKFQLSDGSDLNDGDNYGLTMEIIGNIHDNPELLKQKA